MASDSTSLPIGNIRNVFVDHLGRLWISTFWGICLYDKSQDNFHRLTLDTGGTERRKAFENRVVFEDSHHRIWAGSNGIGLLLFDEKRQCFIPASKPSHREAAAVGSIVEEDGMLWLIAPEHLIRYNPETAAMDFYKYPLPDEEKNKVQAMVLKQDPQDKDVMWIGTWGSGLMRFSKRTGKYVSYKFQKNALFNLGNIVFDICPTDSHTLWLATNTGIQVFNREKNSFDLPVRDSIHDKTVVNIEAYCIYTDDAGIRWIGTRKGLCNINPSKQKFLSHPLWTNTPATHIIQDTASGKYYGVRFFSQRALYMYDPRTAPKKGTLFPMPILCGLNRFPYSGQTGIAVDRYYERAVHVPGSR
jgi:ligand-binding sensor domain-containing protein